MMRKRYGGFGLLVLSASVGCSTDRPQKLEPVYDVRPAGDEAMAMRQWPQSVSYFPSGAVTAYSTRFPYQYKGQFRPYSYVVLDPILFLGQTALLPAEFVANPPGHNQIFRGVVYPPTYTAQPLPVVVPSPTGNARAGISGGVGGAGPVFSSPSNSGFGGPSGGGGATPVGPGNAPVGVPGGLGGSGGAGAGGTGGAGGGASGAGGGGAGGAGGGGR
jgi:hypothetical protein